MFLRFTPEPQHEGSGGYFYSKKGDTPYICVNIPAIKRATPFWIRVSMAVFVHELVHALQWLGGHNFYETENPYSRYKMELQAYSVQKWAHFCLGLKGFDVQQKAIQSTTVYISYLSQDLI